MKKCTFLIFVWFMTYLLFSTDPLTVAERSNYTKTSLYKDVIDFIFEVQKQSEKVKILKLTTSTEGRMIPLVIISKEKISNIYEQKMYNKPSVLIMANIHAGEVEGKEATLMLIRDIGENKLNDLLINQTILVIPIFNADGNDKLGKKNRRDNGPEYAGIRYNGQNLDLNRDYIKLESPEVKSLVKLFNKWDPVLTVDMHTTNGSYHREPVTYAPQTNPNSDRTLQDYMWNKLFPEVSKTLKKKYGYDSIPYGNFVDRLNPQKGWRNHGYATRYGNNYIGLRNRFAILDENYSHADFKTRVLSSYGFIKSILLFTSKHIYEMKKMVHQVDDQTRKNYFNENFSIQHKVEKLFDLTIKSYKFKKEKIKPEDRDKYPPWIKDFIVKKTNIKKDYTIPYFAKAVSTKYIKLPRGYIILPNQNKVIENLKTHGIIVEKIRKEFKANVEQFDIQSVNISKRLNQGHASITLKGQYKSVEATIPKNAHYISMQQSLARLIAELLEPESMDGLAQWGFFNRVIVRQWTNRPGIHPVYRVNKSDIPIEKYQD